MSIKCPFCGFRLTSWESYPEGEAYGYDCEHCDYQEVHDYWPEEVTLSAPSKGLKVCASMRDDREINALDVAVYRAGGKPRWRKWQYYVESEPEPEYDYEIPF